MSFPRYPEYKDSGVEWLGKVPGHWGIKRLKHLADIQNGRDYKEVESDEGYPVIGSGGPFSFASRFIYQGESVLLGRKGTIDRPLYVNGAFWAVDTMFYTVIKPRVNAKFLYYCTLTIRFDRYSTSTALPSMTQSDLNNIEFAVPCYEEQCSITAFLERETTKIDDLMAEQEKLIALLKEKRQAVIAHAVTKGLDPTVPMKDSEVEWLGSVPESWGVKRLSSISTKITNGYVGPTRDILLDDGVRYLQSLHIKKNEIRFNEPYFVSLQWSLDHQKSILQTGDVLIVQTGDIGQVAVVTEEFEGCNCHALIIVSPLRTVILGEWLSWVLNSEYGFHSLLSIQTGALHPHLNCGNVKELFIPVPPLEAQAEAVKYLATETSKFDELISTAQSAIDLLKERRTALISAAVTGQIDVRGLIKDEQEQAA
nr:restriction endonuclease subunit S [uncultured Pseudomonas sp.]